MFSLVSLLRQYTYKQKYTKGGFAGVVEEFIQEVEVQLTAEAGVEAEVEVCLVMLWWITVPGHWRFLHLQRVIEKIFFLTLRYFLIVQRNKY